MDVFDLYAKISLDSNGYEKGLTSAKGSFDKFKVNVGDTLKAVAKITAAAVSAGAAATGKIVKSAVANYGEYEQLVGGIDSLFLESSQKVQDYAKNAFSSAQISENEYMRLVTSFSGAIIKSSENREKAAELSNTAIQDMADQANKYGKTVEEVSQTYTSLARGNFQTLDNLFGGMFAGTKTGLREMLTTAEKYRASLGKTVKYSETSYADIVSAIHDVSEMMGVSGTSAEEAGTTIQGSMASVKAAWQDTLTAIGSGKDIDKKLDNFTRSVKKYGENMKPVIKKALSGAVKVIGELAPDVAAELPKLITELAPDVLKAGADIVTNLATGVLNELDRSNFDETAGKLTEKVNKIIDGFDAEKSGERFSRVINKFINAGFNIASTFDFKETAEKMTTWLNKAVNNLDVAKLGQTVSHVWKGVWDFIGTALEEIDWENVGAKISEFINNIDWAGILDSMFKAIGGIIKAMPDLLKGVIKNLDFESAANAMAVIFAPKAATKLFNYFKTNSATKTTLENAGGAAGEKVSGGMLSKFSGAAGGIVGKISSGLQTAGVLASAFSIGWAIGTEIRKGLEDTAVGKWIDDQAKKLSDIINAGERAKALDTDEEADARENLTRMKKLGFKGLTVNDALNATDAWREALDVLEVWNHNPQLKSAGYSVSWLQDLKANDKEKYAKIRRGDLLAAGIKPATPTTSKPTINNPTDAAAYYKERQQNWKNNASFYKPGSSAATTGINSAISDVNSATNIYLDTGKLVGGTSRTSATQNNYAMRGYAI